MADKIRKWDILLAFFVIVTIVFTRIMPVKCEESYVPEIVNGINSVSGILVGIVMATMAIFYGSDIDYKTFKTRIGAYFLISLGPFAEMWAAYITIISGEYVGAIRNSLGGFSIAIGLLFNVFYFFVIEEEK